MTLSTLKTMNVQMEDLRDSLQIRMPPAAAAEPAPAPAPAPAAAPAPNASAPATGSKPVPGVVDPLQWWGALTKQFTELATNAMKDTASDATRQAGAVMKEPPAPARATAAKKPGAAAKKKSAARKTAGGKAVPGR